MRILLYISFIVLFGVHQSLAQTRVVQLNDTLTIRKLIEKHLLGKGVGKLGAIRFKGDVQSVGLFYEPTGVVGFQQGIALSTGLVEHIAGPNTRNNAGANLGGYFFSDDHLLAKSNMCDGVMIEFEFVPNFDSVCFDFVFGSDEYPEFVGKEFNDLFGFYVWEKTDRSNPKNLALLPNGGYVNVNSINHKTNPVWYVPNDKPTSLGFDKLEWDGYTKPITIGLHVKPSKTYIFKMVIADLTDCEYDSGVIIRAQSLRSIPTRVKPVKKVYQFNFANNDATLDSVSTNRLIKLCDSIAKINFDSIVVLGHTDSIGNSSQNLHLSQSRAHTIATVIRQYTPAVVSAKGLGATLPIGNNQTEKGRAANRRVEIIYYAKPE